MAYCMVVNRVVLVISAMAAFLAAMPTHASKDPPEDPFWGQVISIPDHVPQPVHRTAPLFTPRLQNTLKWGSERTINLTQLWVPLGQRFKDVVYADLRLMGDDDQNFEGNLGVGYRQINGDRIYGVYGYFDRRKTEFGSFFNQITIGWETMSETWDLRGNLYIPLDGDREFISTSGAGGTGAPAPTLAGSGIVIAVPGLTQTVLTEEPMEGVDLEVGVPFPPVPYLADFVDDLRIYAALYGYFGEEVDDLFGYRIRLATDINSWLSLGSSFQHDDERGDQFFVSATLRFPGKRLQKNDGLFARMDETPERDIDIVSGQSQQLTQAPSVSVPVLNATTGQAQQVIHVDNSAPAGGDGSAERPFNTLAAGQAALAPHGVLVVAKGNGTSMGQNAGLSVTVPNAQVIGSGVDFLYDGTRFTTASGANFAGVVLRRATTAPVITNTAGNGVTISANHVAVSGLRIEGASGDGIALTSSVLGTRIDSVQLINNIGDGLRAQASGAGVTMNDMRITNATASGNRNGFRFYAANGGSISARIEGSTATNSIDHGVVVYDDTATPMTVDLGGGTLGSAGLNRFFANTREDLAIEYDGATVSAQNNWWGQAGGPAIREVYYGAPVFYNNLVGHWTFDTDYLVGTTAHDRGGSALNGSLQNGQTAALNGVTGVMGQGLSFDGVNDFVNVNDAPSLRLTGPMTVMFWARKLAEQPDWVRYVGKGDMVNRNYGLWDTTGAPQTTFYQQYGTPNTEFTSTTNVPTTVWTHIAGVRGAAISEIYHDAVQRGTVVNGGTPITSTDPLTFGAASFHTFLNGQMDDVRLYNRALSGTEIAEIHRMNGNSLVNSAGALSSDPRH